MRFGVQQVTLFTDKFCSIIKDELMEVSRAKSVCTASTPTVWRSIAAKLAHHGIKYVDRVTSLGEAVAAGRRRNATVLRARLAAFKKKLPRFRKLARAGVRTARIARTGGVAAITFGQAVTGVAPATLRAQRRAVAHATAPASGPCGQDLDMALLIADGSATGKADPAFDAHTMPIGY